MTTEQFNALVRDDIRRLARPNAVHWVFEWDRETGFSCDRLNYGPYGPSSCSWIVPGSICEDEPYEEEEEEDDEGEECAA